MSGPLREQALSLLAAANNHGDLAVKLSSLRQAKDILFSLEPSLAADLFPYLADLHTSPESLVRKVLIEMFEEIGLKAMEHSLIIMPVLLTLLRDSDIIVARKSIITGTHIFCSVLEELALQFHRRGIVERWLEELWTWMVKFKDAVFSILLEAGSIGTRLLAMKFLETFVLIFTSDSNDSDKSISEAQTRSGQAFNVSWLGGGHPILDQAALMPEANRTFGILMDLFRSASTLLVPLTISVVNCLASIARKRPVYYTSVLSALLDFDPNFERAKGGHIASIHYSLRTAFLGFLRCTYPPIMESRDRLLRALRAMNAGDAADQVLRQVDKMLRNCERASRDTRFSKEEQTSNHMHVSGDLMKKRTTPLDHEEPTNSYDLPFKRMRYGPNHNSSSVPPVHINESGRDPSVNGVTPKVPSLDGNMTPVEQMIAMIGALMAEGERGAESLGILISNIHPDLLADIVITNMKHLPKTSPPLTRLGSLSATQQSGLPSGPSEVVGPISSTICALAPAVTLAQVPVSFSNSIGTSLPDTSAFPADSKRDPRRDPRRFDPRRPVAMPAHVGEDNSNSIQAASVEFESDASISLNRSPPLPVVTGAENTSVPSLLDNETGLYVLESPVVSRADELAHTEEVLDKKDEKIVPDPEETVAADIQLSIPEVLQDSVAPNSSDIAIADENYSFHSPEADQLSPPIFSTPVIEEAPGPDLPAIPLYIEMTEEQKRNVKKLAVERIIDSHKHLRGTDYKQTRMTLLARLVAQIDADDDVVVMMQKHIISDYQHQKGHELVMHVLYHLHTLMISDSASQSSFAATVYEKFLLGVARSLLDSFPATDKSFSRLLGEVPLLPSSVLKLLDEICCSDNPSGKEVRDGDRVTQGLGAVWSLILGRPINRQACLDIALKCAVHSQEDIRAKAIRLVVNKLYVVNYIAENIEQFATNMLLSTVGSTVQRTEGETGSQETSISGSQISEPGTSENDPAKGAQSDSQSDSSVSFTHAQRHISLFFALCTKKPSLLQLVFDNYARAPKAVKQAIHRHIPILIRALGSSCSELLHIISDPPQGSEHLLSQVLHILSEGTIPSAELVATVKRLYESKLKDATILIPILSSFSKNEVLPIFPRLVELPLDKFQIALAHILQGSAHTGPALTPAEVLVAIHAINPEKDGLPLKKITEVCSACFEQRTVFTQQVLAKALNQMVDQSPLPLLFMRTVIQAIDAFPALVDVVMEILSKLVSKQVWRMPKLWVGFLKCVSQTQPHSFRVLLQLPPPQLEGTLNKYGNLRDPLAAYANQPSVKNSLPRSTLILLGLTNETHMRPQAHPASLHSSDKSSSSVHGLT